MTEQTPITAIEETSAAIETDDAATSPTTKTPKSAYGKRMTDEQWLDCKVKWASGQFGLQHLSELYNISQNAIHRRLTRHGIKKGADAAAYQAQAMARQLEDTGNAAAERDARIRAKAIESEEFLLNAVDGVARAGLGAIAKAKKDNLPISIAMDDVKCAKEAVAMFKLAVDTIQKIRGEDKITDGELSSFVVCGLTKQDMEDIAKEREENERLFGDEDSMSDLDELDALSNLET